MTTGPARRNKRLTKPAPEGARVWKKARIALLVLLSVTGGLSSSAARAQSIKIVGIGASTCARFLQEIEGKPQSERDYFAWAQGYMSGLLIRAPAGKDEDLDLTPPAFPLLKQAAFCAPSARRTGTRISATP